MRRFAQIASIVPVVMAGVFACAPAAGAAQTPPMTVTVEQPSGSTSNFFEVSGQPGQTAAAGSLRLQNQTTRRIKVKLDAVRGLTASTLGSAYGLRGSKPRGAAGWVVLAKRKVVLGPRAAVRVPVSVSVPAAADPGDYLAGIGVQPAGPGQNVKLKGNVAISQVQRYAIGLVTSLPGPRHPQIKLTGVGLDREPAGVTFTLRGLNSGNAILKNVKGAATITEGGELIAHRRLGPGTFVTDTSIAYPLLVSSLRPTEGTAYRVQAFLRYRGGIARIDRVVRFGAIDAKRQAAYGGPQVDDGNGGNKLIPILLILLAIGGALAALQWRRRLGPGEAALRRALPSEIAHARSSGEPLSVILVSADGGRSPAKLAGGMRASLRPRDRLFRLDSGAMVVSPDTNPEAGEILAADIRRNLERSGNGGVAVVPVTSAAKSSAEELMEAASAAGEDGVSAGNGHGDNGSGRQGKLEGSSQGEVKHSGTEAPAIGSRGPTRRP